MKTTLFVLCVLCATGALGQATAGVAVLNNQPQVSAFVSHSEHAFRPPMTQEQNLLGGSGYVHARGERPLWGFAPVSQDMPLGDAARILRKEHTTAKKSAVVWTN
jgi:hypothetical protein